MRWSSESTEAWLDRTSRWHRWFAWRPVRVGEQLAWLEVVERRHRVPYTVADAMLGTDWFEYREVAPCPR